MKTLQPNFGPDLIESRGDCFRRWTQKLAFVLVIGMSHDAHASVVYNFLADGTSAGVEVTSNAQFDVSAGKIVLTLTNTTFHTADAGQLLTGLKFSLANGATSINTASMSAAIAMPRNVAGDGTYVDSAAVSILSTWEKKISGNTYQIDFNPNAEFAIIGPADGENPPTIAGTYNANGSINGNPGHNPFTAKMAQFTFLDSSITVNTHISNVSFLYNTALSYSVPGTATTISPIPEPSTVCFGLALAGICATAGVKRSLSKTC